MEEVRYMQPETREEEGRQSDLCGKSHQPYLSEKKESGFDLAGLGRFPIYPLNPCYSKLHCIQLYNLTFLPKKSQKFFKTRSVFSRG